MKRSGLLVVALLAAALSVCVASPAAASGTAITRDEYARAVEQAQAAVDRARPGIEASGPAAALAAELAAMLPAAGQQVTYQGRTYTPDTGTARTLVARLERAGTSEARTEALRDLSAHLASLRDALGVPGAAAPADPAALEDLLGGRRQGRAAGGDWLSGRVMELLDRIAKWLAGLQPGGRGGSSGTGIATLVVLAIPAALAMIVLVRALMAWRRGTSAKESVRPGGAPDGAVVTAGADLPDDPLEFAERLAAEGRRRDAVRALYGGAARRLVDTGAVRRMRTRTNAELLRDVRAVAPHAASALSALTERFEAAWYGHGDPGETGFLAAKHSYAEVMEAADRPAADGPEAGTAGGVRR